ncbi:MULTISPECIES: hypothetical protein [Streptomyces]|uniref:hypothetical protein n=1 Tax=Streptomyces TaxID=1883 RepID=UPI0005DD8532|nr:hypothetical protein [Streptomyces sp. EAG2]KIX79627.1 hypothetical protein SF12_03675 [Streptomyces sp. MBRL 601]PKR46054.1 hypothetical protein CWE27_05580 [Streptomyces sp. EAG2]
MFTFKSSRSAGVGVAAAMLTLATAYPAVAVEPDEIGILANKTLSIPGGTFKFTDDGDVFEICDTAADGKGVYGELWYRTWVGNFERIAKFSDGGDAGCDKKGVNIGNGGQYTMTLCWGGYAGEALPSYPCTHTGTFNE